MRRKYEETYRLLWIYLNIEAKNLEAILQHYRVEFLETIMRLLIFEDVNFSISLNYIYNELRYLRWDKYLFMSLPQYLPNLRNLDLSHSKNLIEMPDLRGVPLLRDLDLEECIKIVRIDPFIGIPRVLISLSLKNCKNLVHNLSIFIGLRSPNLSGCSKLLNNNRLGQRPT
ncbi:hypothetical protein CR513_48252, partial [Mucuna pruriens]